MDGAQVRSTIAVFVLLTGCAMSSEEPKETLEQGVERARTYVEDTLEATAGGYDIIPEDSGDPTECNNGLGMGTGRFSNDYGVKIRLVDDRSAERLFEATASYWESKGYEISLENATRGEPIEDDSVIAVEMKDGYFGALELFPTRGNAFLGISTPCLPLAEEE